MDVAEQIRTGLPFTVEELEAAGPYEIAELWLLARTYSQLRRRNCTRRGRGGFEAMKRHCLELALARAPELFFVFVDPGIPHLWVIYHRVERNLLHVPVTNSQWSHSLWDTVAPTISPALLAHQEAGSPSHGPRARLEHLLPSSAAHGAARCPGH